MLIYGRFRGWRGNSRYAFIRDDRTGEDIFVHADVVEDCSIDPRALLPGTAVKCDVESDPRGRGLRAFTIELVNA